jgi:plasmid stability protein
MVSTLTLKNLPADVHRQLKARAARHGRSLNLEAIACLRAAVSVGPLDVDALLVRAREHRAAASARLTEGEVRALKRQGRP